MIDNMSDGLNRLRNNGSEVIAGFEDSCTRLDSALLQVSKSSSQVSGSLANLFGYSSGTFEQIRILGESADVLNKTGNEAKEYGESVEEEIKAEEQLSALANKDTSDEQKVADGTGHK